MLVRVKFPNDEQTWNKVIVNSSIISCAEEETNDYFIVEYSCEADFVEEQQRFASVDYQVLPDLT